MKPLDLKNLMMIVQLEPETLEQVLTLLLDRIEKLEERLKNETK